MIFDLLNNAPHFFVAWVAAIIVAITGHEFAHALTAKHLGDDTGESLGRLTLNPLAHIDLIGFLALILIGFGWGKPVPFDVARLKNQKYGPALISFAGPLANLFMVVFFGLILKLATEYTTLASDNLGLAFLAMLVNINVILMIFNLVPLPPLDGAKILYILLPAGLRQVESFLERYGQYILLFLILFDSSLPVPILGSLFRFSLGLVEKVF